MIEAAGDTLRIASFTAEAPPGTVSASGTIGVLAPGRPVDVKITARNAKPLSTDLLSAVMDADVTLRGRSGERVDAAGSITISRAEINIPKALPQDVAVLDVRRPGPKAPPAQAGSVIGFDLEVDAPRSVFVRGRGIDASRRRTTSKQISAGERRVRHAPRHVRPQGRDAQVHLGQGGFNGTGLSQKIDPTLDFWPGTAATQRSSPSPAPTHRGSRSPARPRCRRTKSSRGFSSVSARSSRATARADRGRARDAHGHGQASIRWPRRETGLDRPRPAAPRRAVRSKPTLLVRRVYVGAKQARGRNAGGGAVDLTGISSCRP